MAAQRCHASEISEVSVDEGSQHLLITGQFGSVLGSVTVDSAIVSILNWSDSLIVCHIDSDGTGSCGPVQVYEADGTTSNQEILTLLALHIAYHFNTGGEAYLNLGDDCYWNLMFRTDFKFNKTVFASRASTASFSYSRNGTGDETNYGGRLYGVNGTGPIKWLSPTSDSENGFQAQLTNDGVKTLTISLKSILLPKALQAIIISPPDSGHPQGSTVTAWEDYTFQGSPFITIILDSVCRPKQDMLIIQDYLRTMEYYRWNSDSTKFSPVKNGALVNYRYGMIVKAFASAYPNPSSGRVRIAYQLPPGVSFGEVILTQEDGTEMKRYRVTSAFSDLLIDGGDLPSGAYFYKLVTEKGGSPVRRIVIMK